MVAASILSSGVTLSQFGFSVDQWSWALILATIGIYFAVAIYTHVVKVDEFYVAGRRIPAIVNGAATAADWMSGASFISMAGLIAFLGYDGAVYLMGWTGGYVLLALLIAPYLRKYGKFTIPDFIGDRYYSDSARAVAAIATVVISLTYIVGQMRGVGIVMSRFIGVDITLGILAALSVIAFVGVVGGMRAITWTQAIQYSVLIFAYVLVTVSMAAFLTGNPIPQISLATTDFATQLSQIQVQMGLFEYLAPFETWSMWQVFSITFILMIGTAGLPHVIMRFYTVPSASDARRSVGWALFFIAILYTSAPALAVFAKYNLIQSLDGKTLEEIARIGWAQKWQATGLLGFEDLNGNGIIEMAANEITIDRDIIVLSSPEVAQLAPIVVALVAAGGLAAALSTADGLLIAMSSAVAHDIYYKIINPEATEKQRLYVARIFILAAALVAAYFGIYPPGFVAEVVAIAFGLAAASLFPQIILGIFDRRMNREGAIAGIATGLVVDFVLVVLMTSHSLGFTAEPIISTFMGLEKQGVAIIPFILNVIVAYVVSRATSPPPDEIQHLVDTIRIPVGSREIVGEGGIEGTEEAKSSTDTEEPIGSEKKDKWWAFPSLQDVLRGKETEDS